MLTEIFLKIRNEDTHSMLQFSQQQGQKPFNFTLYLIPEYKNNQ